MLSYSGASMIISLVLLNKGLVSKQALHRSAAGLRDLPLPRLLSMA